MWKNTQKEKSSSRWSITAIDKRYLDNFAKYLDQRRRDLAQIKIQGVNIDRVAKFILWMNAFPDYEPLFSILDGMRQDPDRRFWIERLEASEDNCDKEEDTGQMSTGVEIVLQMSQQRSIYNDG